MTAATTETRAGADVSGALLLDRADPTGRPALSAGGLWTAERAGELERSIERVIARYRQAGGAVGGVDIDMGGVERLDTFGARLLQRLQRGRPAAAGEPRIVGLAEPYRSLVLQARELNRAELAPVRRHALAAAIAAVGRAVNRTGDDAVAVLAMIGALAAALGRAVARPASF